MKINTVEKISNKYSVIKQVFEDKVQIRTNNIIYSIKYNAYMFLLSNNSCIWIPYWKIADIYFGESQFKHIEKGYLVEVSPDDFKKVKTYDKNFENFDISEENKIVNYEQLKELAQKQEDLKLVTKFD